jgi:ATP-dependent Clp protease ATP-binding subunit ClpC
MNGPIDLNHQRAQQARLSRAISKQTYRLLLAGGGAAAIAAIVLGFLSGPRYGLLLASPALLCYLPAVWWKRQLSVLPPEGTGLAGRLSGDVLARLKPDMAQNSQTIWQALNDDWQARFFTNHLLLTDDVVAANLSAEPGELSVALQLATDLADQNNCPTIEVGFVVAGLMLASVPMRQTLVKLKLQPEDVQAVANWLGRALAEATLAKRNFGGIGRDWAFGYTPLLDRFGTNLSLAISQHGAYFGWLTKSEGVHAIEAAFDNHASAVALIGPDGIGKTSSVNALAQRLIEGQTVDSLAYHQIISLNATDITSNASKEGDLEQIMLSLAGEAAHAGHVILFFDDAQLFFSTAPGSFDATHILLSIIQARSVPMILAMSPSDYQRLRSSNQSLATLLTPVVLQELPEDGVMRVLEDTAAGLESRHNVLIAYEALHEAYRLSGRYEQDEAYPGKAIKLLEQALTHSDQSLVTAVSVQEAIEQARGVKVGTAAPAEVDSLLHLEDRIHERMINQSQAVTVVSGALRRARAGVANPRRPIGSFLFLGPTGVGKTELAKAIAATYFGAESNMVRLDMSEYQQPEDVSRLLSDGRAETKSLIMVVREQPFSVVLLDEIEKAHPNILNLLLQLLDEGQLTDTGGRTVSFKDCIIICTSNAGAQTIRERVQQGEAVETFQPQLVDELINSGQFKPELLNRFDEIVLFRPLTQPELSQVVRLMMTEINQTLAKQNISVKLTPAAVEKIVAAGYDPRLGARPMRRTLQRAVEDIVAQKILRGEAQPGDAIELDGPDLALQAPAESSQQPIDTNPVS